MTSILLSIMSFIAILIIPREATQLTDNYSSSNVPLLLARGRCPTTERKDFDVISYNTQMYESCAKLDIEITSGSNPEMAFIFVFGQRNQLGQRICIYDKKEPLMMMFTCTLQSSSPSVDPKTESSIVRLYGRVIEPTLKYEIRCAMYKNVDGIMQMMAISANKSCEGLPYMLRYPMSSFPSGNVLLYLPRHIQRRSTFHIKI